MLTALVETVLKSSLKSMTSCVGTGLLCLFFHLLCYAAVLKNFNFYAQK